MEYSFDLDWDLIPLGGESGQSYKGIKNNEQIFLKRNTTPFLAALSVEGIVPKLLWSKRTAHGEGITAQEWINAKNLAPSDMVQFDILDIIKYIHTSKNLKNMLLKIQGEAKLPADFLNHYFEDLQTELKYNTFLTSVVHYLESVIPAISNCQTTVCHGDLNHRNFLIDQTNRVYVVDWESVRIADPISDCAAILCDYVKPSDWLNWLNTYGFVVDDLLKLRLKWYSIYHCLMNVKKYHFQGRNHLMNYNIMMIKEMMNQM